MSDQSEAARQAAPIEQPQNLADAPVHGLTCPSCSGSLEVRPGLRVIVCPFCGTALLVTTEIGTRRLAVEPRIDTAEARSIAGKWLASGWNRDRALRREAEIGEALLCFLPFYRVEADCIGFALGTEERRRSVGSGKSRRTQTYEVDVERSVATSLDRTYAGLNVAEWGVQRVDLGGDRLVPFEPMVLERLGMVFPPTGSESLILKRALEQFESESDPSHGLKRVRFKFLETLRERLSVVYYPLWLVRYRFRGRSYQLLVDAEDGSLSYGKAPGNDLYRALMMVASQAVALFIATTALQWTGVDLEGFAAVGIFVFLVLLWGWRKFRHGGVVVEGSGVEPEPWLPESVATLVGRKPSRLLGQLVRGQVPRWQK